jgi:hypothetical protein
VKLGKLLAFGGIVAAAAPNQGRTSNLHVTTNINAIFDWNSPFSVGFDRLPLADHIKGIAVTRTGAIGARRSSTCIPTMASAERSCTTANRATKEVAWVW